jgi:hypothetical protein
LTARFKRAVFARKGNGGGMRTILATALAATAAASASAEPFKMRVQESEGLRLLYFHPAETYLTPHATRSFYNSLEFQERVFDWTPWEKTSVILKDFSDYGNAGARSSPNNALIFDIAPLSRVFETFTASERIYSLMNHELVHVATMDAWNERDAFWRKIFFGKPMPEGAHPETILYNYLATPRVNVPRWHLEGSAVFMETWMAGGLGRAQGAYDEMVFRSMVRDDAHFYSALGLVSKGIAADFQGGVNAYLYGTRFFNYLALAYSPEQVVEWLSRDADSKAYYSSQFKHVFGAKLTDVWDRWIAFEHDFQRENLAAVNAHPTTSAERLSPRALGSMSRAYFNAERNSLIGAFRYPGVIALVGELDMASGKVEHLTDVKGPMLYRVTSLAYDSETDTAWYTTDNYSLRDLVELDVRTGKKKVLQRDQRIGDLVFNSADRTLWGVRHLNGYATLVRMTPPYDKWEQIRTWPFGEDLYDVDISRDGALLAMSVGSISGAQTLKVFKTADLMSGKFEPVASHRPGSAVPEGAAFSADGRFVFFSSYYTGVSNVFRLEVANGAVEAVSNAETGFVRPIPLADGSLIVFEYTGEGFTPVKIVPEPLQDVGAIKFLGAEVAARHPIVKTWAVGSPMKIDLKEIAAKESDYKPRGRIGLGSAYPIVEGYLGAAAFGWHFNFEDPMQFAQIDVTLSYSPGQGIAEGEHFHADVRYKGINWSARYWHNDADFYDLFGPTKRARAGDAFLVGYKRNLIYDTPRELAVHADLGYYIGLDQLPTNQNVFFSLDHLVTAEVGLKYTNTSKSLGAVDHEKGWRWNAAASLDRASGQSATKLYGGIDFGAALPLRNSSVWLYNAAGFANGDASNPLASFYFGGFKNNYVDDREVKRYREFETMPGFEIDEIAAETFFKSVAEWNLPPLRFESVGAPSLYLGSLRPAIFAGALIVDPGRISRRNLYTLGAQIDFNFTLAHRLPMTLSAGFASGFESGTTRDDEFMISLKIM